MLKFEQSFVTSENAIFEFRSVAAMHNPYANHNPAASVQNHVMGASTGVPDVHKRDKDAIYG